VHPANSMVRSRAALSRYDRTWDTAFSAQRVESVQDYRPSALDARLVRGIRQAKLVGQDEQRLRRDRCELQDHAVISLRVFFDE